MNKLCLVMTVVVCLAVVAPARANILVNGDFEDGDIGPINGACGTPAVGLPGWENWGGACDSWHHSDSGRYIGEKAIAIFWVTSGVGQYFDVTEGKKYAIGAEFLSSTSTDTYNGQPANMWGKDDIMAIQWYDPCDVQIITGNEDVDTDGDEVDDAIEVDRFEGGEAPDNPTELEDVWVLKGDMVQAPAGAAEGYLIIVQQLRPGHTDTTQGGGCHIDEAFVIPAEQARNPNPRDGAIVSTLTDELSWTQPDPADPCDTVICYVYFACTTDGDPNVLIAVGEIDSVTLSAVSTAEYPSGITLEDDKEYHWAVDCNDTGTLIMTEGPRWWTFGTGNGPPEVTVGISHIWLTMDDGDEDANSVVFELTAEVTDDGKPSNILYYTWEVTGADSSIPTIEWLDPNTAETPKVKFFATGSWWFELTVDDTNLTGSDGGQVIVYDSACAAAIGDPGDEMLAGDINEDCETNILDVVLVAESWLQCMSDKLIGIRPECTP